MSQSNSARRVNLFSEQTEAKPVQYTPGPWRILEQSQPDTWVVIGESPSQGVRELARVPLAGSNAEQRANARLIAQAPSMHRAAVKLVCAWGTEDASEAMEELALILSKAVRS